MTTFSSATIRRMVAAGTFPASLQISPGVVAWSREAVEQWIAHKLGRSA